MTYIKIKLNQVISILKDHNTRDFDENGIICFDDFDLVWDRETNEYGLIIKPPKNRRYLP